MAMMPDDYGGGGDSYDYYDCQHQVHACETFLVFDFFHCKPTLA
jgi:hypothetical protein